MPSDIDRFVPDPEVCKEFDVTPMTLWRWERDPHLGFPPKIKIKTRNYRSRRGLDEFRARMVRESVRSVAPTHPAVK